MKPLTVHRLKIYAFLVYTRIAFYTSKILNEVGAFAAAYSPDSMKVRTKVNLAAPTVYSARVLCKKAGATHNITNLANLVVDSAWDPTACGNTGGIQLNQLGHFTKYYNPDLIWICYGLSGALNPSPLNPSEPNRHYILIDMTPPMHIFRYTRSTVFESNDIKKITDPMFGELSFDPHSTWE